MSLIGETSSLPWKEIFVGLMAGKFVFDAYLDYRQYQVLNKKTVPPTLKNEVSVETLAKSQDYSKAKMRTGIFASVFELALDSFIVKYNAMNTIWEFSGFLMRKCGPILPSFMGGIITQSLFFVNTFSIIDTIIKLPISYYMQFVLEEKYGFNKSTVKLWIVDKLKGIALTIALGSPVIAGFIKIIDYFGKSFVFYMCLFVLFIQIIAMTIFPTLILPLFNKFTPLEDGELKTAIEDLAVKQNFPLNKLFVVDGSTRSSHSNAYFVGLPWSKQIVLYDTLIEHSTTEEIVAVLAHEIGHWKLSHLPKSVVIQQVPLATTFYLLSFAVFNKSLYNSFGFNQVQPIIIGFYLFNYLSAPVNTVTQFLMNLVSRKHEYEADAFAKKENFDQALGTSLIKLNTENLSDVEVDWLYSAYHRSHPTLAERLNAIGYISKGKVASVKKEKKEIKDE